MLRISNAKFQKFAITVLQSLTQKKSNFASEKAKLSCLAGWLSFALPQAKLLFFCVKDCRAPFYGDRQNRLNRDTTEYCNKVYGCGLQLSGLGQNNFGRIFFPEYCCKRSGSIRSFLAKHTVTELVFFTKISPRAIFSNTAFINGPN